MRFFVPYETKRPSTPDERAGRLIVPGRVEYYVDSVKPLAEEFIVRLRCQLIVWSSHHYRYYLTYGGTTEALTDLLRDQSQLTGADIRLEVRQDLTVLYTHPGGSFQYTYPDLLVQCDGCQAFVLISELESANGDDAYSDQVCPRCGAWDCVELVYEKD